ncbi:LacI family DNA-binding transcriptional regulator [Cellulomonas sp. NPDC058312]|uniref:LacI family DNA-binding transcriptional regulator n=1 Tax=Cellulomonas sp. NPDC058312 TaxID=3346441 RepID=UPI0036E8F54C
MSDVAALAGVSHQTVSRVLNDHPSVRPETRERVLSAIAELGYRRNSAARALVTRRSGALGVLTTASADHGPTSTLLGLESAAREVGYYVSVAAIDRFDAGTMRAALDHFLDQAVEGIAIIAPQVDVAEAVTAFAAPVPVVTVTSGAHVAGPGRVVAVGVDQREGARAATRHLVDLGHREVVHLAGPQDWFDAQERLAGWREACAAAGVAAPDPVEVDWSAESGYREGLRLVDAGLPTAVLAANDQLALGLLRAFWERGVRVPQDVSVVGFDDEAGAAYFVPPLTTVRQDFPALGRSAIDALVRALAGEDVPRTLLPATLVPRASTAAPRPSATSRPARAREVTTRGPEEPEVSES